MVVVTYVVIGVIVVFVLISVKMLLWERGGRFKAGEGARMLRGSKREGPSEMLEQSKEEEERDAAKLEEGDAFGDRTKTESSALNQEDQING